MALKIVALQFWPECGCTLASTKATILAGFQLSTGGFPLSLRLIYLKPPPLATSNVAEPSTTWALFSLLRNGCPTPVSKLKSRPLTPPSVNQLALSDFKREPISWANGNLGVAPTHVQLCPLLGHEKHPLTAAAAVA